MRFINKWGSFINEEWSKNDPIPELTRQSEKLGIILLGVPGSGKSTFANSYIKPHNRNIKTFSTDDVSLMFTKDPSKYHVGATELNLSYLDNYIQTGQNFVYDTTGSNQQGVFKVFKSARKMGYKLIFILLLTDLETAKRQNVMRGQKGGHVADEDYVEFVYSMQRDTTRDYLKYLKPDNFYIVLKKEAGYKFMKFSPNGELLKRKVDKYVSFIKESLDKSEEVDNIVDTMMDFIDDGEGIVFKSSTGDMTYTDYLDKNLAYQKFNPVIKSRNHTSSRFSIFYFSKDKNYDNLMTILSNMQSVVGRLGGFGWTLSDFGVYTDRGVQGEKVSISKVTFEFSKPFNRSEGDMELPDEDELRNQIKEMGIGIDRLRIGDYETELDFFSHSWDGELNSEKFYDDRFERICDIFGFSSYDLDYRGAKVIFEH